MEECEITVRAGIGRSDRYAALILECDQHGTLATFKGETDIADINEVMMKHLFTVLDSDNDDNITLGVEDV